VGSPVNTAGNVHVYAATAGHSVWFSEDGGSNWVHPDSHSGMYLEARAWCLAEKSPGCMYAGTDMGLFLWTEETARWESVNSSVGEVWSIALDPAREGRVLVGTRPGGVMVSADAGLSFTRADLPGLAAFSSVNEGPTRTTQIVFDPLEPRRVYVTVEISGFFISEDGGDTWVRSSAGLVSEDLHGIAIAGTSIANRVLLATTNRGLHRSRDGGLTWSYSLLPTEYQYTRGVLTHPTRACTVFVTNGNGPPGTMGKLFRSDDSGESFVEVDLSTSLQGTLWGMVFCAGNPEVAFVYTNLGQVLKSRDGGVTWDPLPHAFGELRGFWCRMLAAGIRKAPHSLPPPRVAVQTS